MRFILPLAFTLSACGTAIPELNSPEGYLGIAHQYMGYQERANRKELKAFLGVDPVLYEWCAAFVNASLKNSGITGSESVSDVPLMARSFLSYGERIDEPQQGDIVILERGTTGWQGHVGFYVEQKEINGVNHYALLSGNNNDTVDIDWYSTKRVLGIRRPTSANLLEHQVRSLLVKILDDQQSLLLAQFDQSQHNLLVQ